MLGKMAWETKQLHRHIGPPLGQFALGVDAAFRKSLKQVLLGIEPVVRLGDYVDDYRVYTQCLAGFAQRAARPISGHGRSERGAVASILGVQVLDHLFAPLVLEIDIDVGRLATFLGYETLEQQVAARGIDFRDAKAIAHSRVRG